MCHPQRLTVNLETNLLVIALHLIEVGDLDSRNIDLDTLALQLSTALLKLDNLKPGVMQRYGWFNWEELQRAGEDLNDMINAHPIEGMSVKQVGLTEKS